MKRKIKIFCCLSIIVMFSLCLVSCKKNTTPTEKASAFREILFLTLLLVLFPLLFCCVGEDSAYPRPLQLLLAWLLAPLPLCKEFRFYPLCRLAQCLTRRLSFPFLHWFPPCRAWPSSARP